MKLEKKHALPTRLFHWTNAIVLPLMIWSGILIYWAHQAYEINIMGFTVFKFFPDWFFTNRFWAWDHRLAQGMAWHFAVMWLFIINGVLYVVYTLLSGEWRYLAPNLSTFQEAWQVVLHDLGIRKQPLPPAKFNGAQRLAYTGVVMMGLGSLVTGFAVYKPERLALLTNLLGGYQTARALHFALTLGYVGFFIIHIAQVIRAGWNNFRAMVIGVELVKETLPEAKAHE